MVTLRLETKPKIRNGKPMHLPKEKTMRVKQTVREQKIIATSPESVARTITFTVRMHTDTLTIFNYSMPVMVLFARNSLPNKNIK